LISCENRQERENKLITISLNKANAENKKLSETIEEIRYLKLNTPGDGDLIGKIDKLLFYRDLIIILDKGISKSVYVFNNKGNFLTKIGKIGDGPGEYQMPQDVTLDKKNNEIIIYCSYSQKLIYFSLDGQLQREKKIGLRFRGMHFLKENKLAIFTQCIYNYQDNYGPIPYDFIICDTTGEILHKQFRNKSKLGSSIVVISTDSYFTDYNNDIYLSWVFNDTIYKLDNNTMKAYYRLDFGHKSIDKEALTVLDNSQLLLKVISGEFWAKLSPVLMADDKILIKVSFGDMKENEINYGAYYAITSLSQNTTSIFKITENDIDDCTVSFPISTHGDYFVSVSYPEEIIHQCYDDKPNLIGVNEEIIEYQNPILVFRRLK